MGEKSPVVPRLSNALTERLRVAHPIFQAGMGHIARPELVAAVCEAGGLGTVGASTIDVEQLRDEIREVRSLTAKPFGVTLVFPPQLGRTVDSAVVVRAHEMIKELENPDPRISLVEDLLEPARIEEQIAVCLEENVPVLVSGLGTPRPFMDDLHAAGVTVMSLTGSVKAALSLQDDGVDAVIASGTEGGGHTGRVSSLPLWDTCLKRLSVPVIAAGGVADGRTLAAALLMGCQGAWVGTRFVATKEATAHPRVKQRYVEANADDAVITKSYSGKPMRVIRNDWVDRWTGDALPFPLQMIASNHRLAWALFDGDVNEGGMPAGQGIGVIDDIPSAADLIERMIDEAAEHLLVGANLVRSPDSVHA